MRIAIIGVGRIGALLEEDRLRPKPTTHLGAWKEIADHIAIADIDTDRSQKVAQKWKVDAVSVASVFEDSYDVVSVATPTKWHYYDVMELAAGEHVKAIFCEKPLAETATLARDMVTACKTRGIKLAVNHTRAWDPIFRDAQRRMVERTYGEFIAGTGYFSGDTINDGCHMAHLANWFGLDEHFQVYNVRNIEYLLFELDLLFERGRIKILENGNAYEVYRSKPSFNYEQFNELQSEPIDVYKLGLRDKDTLRVITPMLRACKQVYESAISPSVEPYCTGEQGLAALERALRWKNAQT